MLINKWYQYAHWDHWDEHVVLPTSARKTLEREESKKQRDAG